MKIVRFLLLALSIVGAGLSAVSLQNHYATSATDYCDLSQTFNCDLVNRSTYSAVHGVPVARSVSSATSYSSYYRGVRPDGLLAFDSLPPLSAWRSRSTLRTSRPMFWLSGACFASDR